MMASLEEHWPSPERFPKTARLLPLPNLVLFPHVMQPLHICEPRYRELLEAALAGDGLIAVAVLARGWEQDYDGRPPLLPFACLGRIVACHRLHDGSYNVLLAGLRRVRLSRELPPAKSYREADVEVLDDVYPPTEAAAVSFLQRRLRGALERIVAELPEAEDQLDHLLNGDVSLGALTDVFSYVLDINPEAKHALLAEPNVHRRAELLLEHIAAATTDTAPGRCGRSGFPPQFGLN